MKSKFILTINIIVIMGLLFVGCSSTAQTNSSSSITQQTSSAATPVLDSSSTATTGEKTFTAAELSKFDGQNGNPAYIAVDGIVYDVSKVRQWRNGQHNGYSAGKDLTNAFKTSSPHDSSIFNGIPVVGKYVGK